MAKKLTLSLAAAATVIAGGAAFAAPGGYGAGKDVTRAKVQERSSAMFDRMDANGDGMLDEADHTARLEKRFQKMDADGDGALSQQEFTAAHEKRGGKRGHKMGRHRGMRGMMGGMPRANADGPVTKAAFQAAALARFDAADANSDGTLTAGERKAAHQAMREQRKDRRAARNNTAS
ncbi:EF-hand domain-containing protein [Altericroceibacterium endophyticum]|uniref:EF-hand domain-containing protein n=1 Tax=Altericroceibacterium endophyticum TaxID=1808508 RepID=A0A6I4T794_9SPHN|nr:EF-hand domain-containing protein [Altericroceibacterium endophyticum]MXO65843.1 hypothetical protein [Altericroceibacterium endophyticum]